MKATDAKKEDDGYLLSLIYNSKANKTNLAIVDAQSMEFICSVDLNQQLGYGLHGSFKYAEPTKSTAEDKKTGFSVTIKNTG